MYILQNYTQIVALLLCMKDYYSSTLRNILKKVRISGQICPLISRARAHFYVFIVMNRPQENQKNRKRKFVRKETGEEAGKIKPEIAGAQRARNVGDSVLTVDAYAIWSGQPTKWREFPTFGQKLNWYASLY